ncbi:MAG TPA: excinuclease ABC subunit UvrA [Candidatus Polarisedimenticolia bacterium]|jgi:excinuclease ABC subunit A|nr:excinuclease ABC subunit UvrA [Candidatus Polarisedimenticolia bacterium]
MAADSIVIKGAAEHNLKHIDLTLPRNRMIVITGLSGSGKSSLAFDTIYAEGQRRYVESLSAYARQFLEQMEKPEVESIEGLSPAISIEQKTTSRNPRSTVGTVTEIYDYLRLLFARIGLPHCPQCGRPIARQTVQQIVDQVMEIPAGTRLQVLAPIVRGRKGEYRKELREMLRKGFVRARIDDEVMEIDEDIDLDKKKAHTIEIVVDRLVLKPEVKQRLTDSLEVALKLAEGLATVNVLGEQARDIIFSDTLACPYDGVSVPELAPRMFSFNSPYGACPTCDGLGAHQEIDPAKIVTNPNQSVADGAISGTWGYGRSMLRMAVEALGRAMKFDPNLPFKSLPKEVQRVLLYGSGRTEYDYEYKEGRNRYFFRKPFKGVIPSMMQRYRESESSSLREEIERYMSLEPCAVCEGARLKPESLAVTVADHNIHYYTGLTIKEANAAFNTMSLSARDQQIAHMVMKEIRERLGFLLNVGLGYLSLSRTAATLSGGEGQRIRLATQIGSRLTGVLYVLDEPSIGLHQRDNRRLLDTLCAMRDLGNTVIVVEHDEETIRTADHVVDLGPGAGELGGRVVAQGTPEEIAAHPDSITGQYLSGRRAIPIPKKRRTAAANAKLPEEGWLSVVEAEENNLKKITARFPLGLLTCVTGVSGSGKSTLVNETLYKALAKRIYRMPIRPGKHKEIRGLDQLDKVIDIDQSPIGRTPRSNPATYTGLFTPLRELFAQVPEARARGYRVGRFSFNVKGGRCEKCEGDGIIKIEMHFLPDVYVTCEDCKGRRYNRETLEVRYKGKNIADVLDMSITEALEFFQNVPMLRRKLETLDAVGLSYIKLGQSATTLSGGEAQRIKLSKELSRRATGRTVYILDEPTTGLHLEDIRRLLDVLNALVEAGNTVIVIEHNLDVIKTADWIIDLGPEGGDEGGRIVAEGTPEKVARVPASPTGAFLKGILGVPSLRLVERQTAEPPQPGT